MRRVISGTALLLAFVPPSQPIIIMGASTASHPVRNEKSGRSGRTAAISRIMNARSPDESLIPTTRGNSASLRVVGTSIGLANIGILYSVTSIGEWLAISAKYGYTACGVSPNHNGATRAAA